MLTLRICGAVSVFPPYAMHIETSRFALFVTQTAHFMLAGNSRECRTSRLSVSFCLLKLRNRQGVPLLWVQRPTIVIVGCVAGCTRGNHRQRVGQTWGKRRGESSPCYSSSAETFVVCFKLSCLTTATTSSCQHLDYRLLMDRRNHDRYSRPKYLLDVAAGLSAVPPP